MPRSPLILLTMAATAVAAAQPSASDVQAAGAAFAEGQRAQLAGEHDRAAELYELAHRSAPNPVALRAAMTSRIEAGSWARAGTLGAEALAHYPDDAETRAVAEQALRGARERFAELRVSCASPCALTLDGRLVVTGSVETLTVFTAPGEHRVAASFEGAGDHAEVVSLALGAAVAVALAPDAPVTAPETEAAPVDTPPVMETTPAEPATDDAQGGGLHPAVFGVLAGLTGISLGLTIASGIDTLSARDAYVANPTEAGFFDGRDREIRTTVMIVGTSVLAGTTLLLAIFTDWGGREDAPQTALPRFDLGVGPGGGMATLTWDLGGAAR